MESIRSLFEQISLLDDQNRSARARMDERMEALRMSSQFPTAEYVDLMTRSSRRADLSCFFGDELRRLVDQMGRVSAGVGS